MADGFNSRARMGRDRCPFLRSRRQRVSTHAPAWGAIIFERNTYQFRMVSTHAPAWGAILSASRNNSSCRSFNSRARMGRDFSLLPQAILILFQLTRPHGARLIARLSQSMHSVSTHAPAWGAIPSPSTDKPSTGFQLTRPHGARFSGSKIHLGVIMFQLTRPHGARYHQLGHKA